MCSTTSRELRAVHANRRSDTSARLSSSAKWDSLNVASTDLAAAHTYLMSPHFSWDDQKSCALFSSY
jgi:hypothetical protein